MLKDLVEFVKSVLKHKVVRKALRNATIVSMYTFFSSILILDAISIKVILVSLATGGLVLSTELANYFKVSLEPTSYVKTKKKNTIVQVYEPFFNL